VAAVGGGLTNFTRRATWRSSGLLVAPQQEVRGLGAADPADLVPDQHQIRRLRREGIRQREAIADPIDVADRDERPERL